MNNQNKIVTILVTALVIVSLAFGALGIYTVANPPDSGVEAKAVERGALLCATEAGNCVESWNASDLVVYSDAGSTQRFLVDGATGDIDVDGTLKVDENANVQTGAQNFTPTATFYEFAPAAVLTLTLQTTGAAAGDILILANTVATDVTVVDTGATVGGGDITLGSDGDMAIFIYTGGAWAEIASPDNS